MNIIFQDNGKYLDEWMHALQQHLPDAKVRVWQEGDHAAADYAIVWKPLNTMLDDRGDLKAIFSRGAGVDGILQCGSALPNEVPVIRLTDAGMGIQMAEYVTHAVLTYFRQFDVYAEQSTTQTWAQYFPQDRKKFTIGILGMGILGHKIIQALQPFNFPILAWSRTPKELYGVKTYSGSAELPAFLNTCKVVVCILPLTDDTRDILNHSHLSMLPKGAYVINVARGAHVVEEDLLALIQSGHIAGASLDVFVEEPLPITHPFWQEKRITITPHIAAVTMIDESALQIAQKIAALEKGGIVEGIVVRDRGY